MLRQSGIRLDRETLEVREAQCQARYAYRMAVDPPTAKELLLFGLGSGRIEPAIGGTMRTKDGMLETLRLYDQVPPADVGGSMELCE